MKLRMATYVATDVPKKWRNKYKWVEKFRDDLARVMRKEAGEDLYGFINRAGQETVECKYAWVRIFHNSLAAVQCMESKMWGFVDTKGKEVIKCQYTEVEDFSEGLSQVRTKEYLRKFINVNGVEVNIYI